MNAINSVANFTTPAHGCMSL